MISTYRPERGSSQICPLCGSGEIRLYHKDSTREYCACGVCDLVFVPAGFHVSFEEEKSLYDMHENSVDDSGYLTFLSRFSEPLLDVLGGERQLVGLDYGCGPAPALAKLLEKGGHKIHLWDPMYVCEDAPLKNSYDFITSTEVVEHFREPAKEFDLLFSLVKENGWLGIMTKMVRDQKSFRSWHYIRDLTHIAFYSRATFSYLGKRYGATVSFVGKDVIFFRKR